MPFNKSLQLTRGHVISRAKIQRGLFVSASQKTRLEKLMNPHCNQSCQWPLSCGTLTVTV